MCAEPDFLEVRSTLGVLLAMHHAGFITQASAVDAVRPLQDHGIRPSAMLLEWYLA